MNYEAAIDAFIEDYEMLGEGEDGRDASYTPDANDRALLKDAIMGLLSDDAFVKAWDGRRAAPEAAEPVAPSNAQIFALSFNGHLNTEAAIVKFGRAVLDLAGNSPGQAGRDAVEARPAVLPALDDDLRTILGRPNFMCARLAQDLRTVGFEIARKSEDEQATVLHYMLGFYLSHGAGWADACGDDMERRVAALPTTTGRAAE